MTEKDWEEFKKNVIQNNINIPVKTNNNASIYSIIFFVLSLAHYVDIIMDLRVSECSNSRP